MQLNSFYYALSLLDSLFGISIPEDQFEEIALVGWNHIGNKIMKLYRLSTDLKGGNSLELPCNCNQLEAVTSGNEEWDYSTNDTTDGNLKSFSIEQYIESKKFSKSPLYIQGKFVDYEKVGNTLYFTEPQNIINVLYKGELLDDEGLPQLTDKEALAIATFCAYTIKFKEGLMTNNSNLIQLSNVLKQQWDVRVDQARVDYYLTQNDWDNVLDAKTSWNRKIHGKSLKMYR